MTKFAQVECRNCLSVWELANVLEGEVNAALLFCWLCQTRRKEASD